MDTEPNQLVNHQDPMLIIENLCETLKTAIAEHRNDQNVLNGVSNMQKTVLKIKTANGLASSLHLFGKEAIGSGSGKRSKRIRVQPTGIARREAGKTKTSRPLWRGRPKRVLISGQKSFSNSKRPHNLLKNILKNRQNGKKHGDGH